jgi:hypothetical protein
MEVHLQTCLDSVGGYAWTDALPLDIPVFSQAYLLLLALVPLTSLEQEKGVCLLSWLSCYHDVFLLRPMRHRIHRPDPCHCGGLLEQEHRTKERA